VVLAAVVLVIATGCGSNEEAAPLPPEPIDMSRCLDVSPAVVTAIETGLDVPGNSIRGAQAVRSSDFKRIYLVTADLEGDALEATDDYATWATNRLDGSGSYWAADPGAEEFSDWGPLPNGTAIGTDGYEESHDCVKAVLEGG
jgi:hypothetical protein